MPSMACCTALSRYSPGACFDISAYICAFSCVSASDRTAPTASRICAASGASSSPVLNGRPVRTSVSGSSSCCRMTALSEAASSTYCVSALVYPSDPRTMLFAASGSGRSTPTIFSVVPTSSEP